ncbi:hypothetical protein EJB05_47911 [Eragrostis curvula]|uniref:RRP15-like protein n=1 Tax=Eragrostis curvula TaxID=38414 RepID=A0A5J9T0L3_9POAL|nr:hypothetical protein EJB05_47911 [Eragrostis curvula]
MAAAQQAVSAPPSAAAAANPGKRKRPSKGKGGKSKKKKLARSDEPLRRRTNKPSAKFLKLLKKRARDYNSDDDEDDKQEQEEEEPPSSRRRRHDDNNDEEEEEAASSSGDESGGTGAGGVTRFEQGCRAFRVAFLKIMSKKLPDDPLGPILLANKKLVAAKLAEEAEEHKPKAAARKEKREAAEKGHFLPKELLDSHDKELMKIATQGVVRLFNAVSKAQKPRKDLNPSSTRDAKVLAKERKKTFLRELESTSHQDKKGQASSSFSKHIGKDDDEPAWAPLRDTYMLGSKLKDWDKMQDSAAASEQTKVPVVDSSDEE